MTTVRRMLGGGLIDSVDVITACVQARKCPGRSGGRRRRRPVWSLDRRASTRARAGGGRLWQADAALARAHAAGDALALILVGHQSLRSVRPVYTGPLSA